MQKTQSRAERARVSDIQADLYEVLQLSPNASSETIDRVYKLLAKRYHPDNQVSGDAEKFSEVHGAFQVLSDPERRSSYDATRAPRTEIWRLLEHGTPNGEDRENDRRLFQGILSLLYSARRRDPWHGGLGSVTLERLLGCPSQELQFPLWYLKSHGWIETLDTGQIAITVEGIDKLLTEDGPIQADRLLEEAPEDKPAPKAGRGKSGFSRAS